MAGPARGVALSAVAAALPGAQRRGDDARLFDVTHDSRQARPGSLFCAIPGAVADGHDHAAAAAAAGAAALLVERFLDLPVPQLRVESVRRAAGPAAAVVHRQPSRELRVVGVTGTNGKTTTTFLLEDAFGAAGWGTGTIGTVQTRIHGAPEPGGRTTPEGPDLQRLLRRMRDRGVDAVGMEVSSHGLDLRRVDGTRFAVAVFTNLSQDHLDWHGTLEAYFAAKARLFTPALCDRAVVCVDDAWGRRLARDAAVPMVTYGRHEAAQRRLAAVTATLDGSRGMLTDASRRGHGEVEVVTPLAGEFNLVNAAGAYLAAVAAGADPAAVLQGIAASRGAPGRLEQVSAGQPFHVVVDYAHTPEALRRVIQALRSLAPPGARLHVVVGCGGDRDRTKRPGMGAAAMAADRVVLTSDNPRSEDPGAILSAVVAGARATGAATDVTVEPDRRGAIATALAAAAPGDVVLIAGKGHETTQELADRTIPFDDRVVAAELLRGSQAVGA